MLNLRLLLISLFLICQLGAVGSQWSLAQESQLESQPKNQTAIGPAKNLILVTLDGLRREELFSGAEIKLMNKASGGVRDAKELKSRFWRESSEERRKALLPFFWNSIANQGQLIGDPELESDAKATNGLFFSYPGYNELLTGKADPAIVSNAKRPNPNQTVLEWLHNKPEFKGKVAAFGSWDVFPFIINAQRSGIPVNAGWQELTVGNANQLKFLNRSAQEIPHVWPNVRYDVYTFNGALEYIQEKRPRVIYVAFGETDDWAHDGRYDLYLDSAHRTDQYLKEIWNTIQKSPHYKNKTAMLISTDHGRGGGREGWKNHGVTLAGSDKIWFAALGPGIPALGNRQKMQVTQSQFASTAAALLGLDFDAQNVAPPINFQTGPGNQE